MKKLISYGLGFVAFFTLIITALVLYLGSVLKDEYLSKSEIYSLVNENYSTIFEDISNRDFDDTLKISGIEKIEDKEGAIVFDCGGKGNAASGVYYGFYYADDGLPKISFMSYLLCDESKLKPEGDGYSCSEGDYYYTENIRDNIYYYESHF